ncbi:hypothetical protein BGZ67_001220 [Mortierella alpina]|nr:hypothetical protein BGZ67_001220 [Mortierella alpina]
MNNLFQDPNQPALSSTPLAYTTNDSTSNPGINNPFRLRGVDYAQQQQPQQPLQHQHQHQHQQHQHQQQQHQHHHQQQQQQHQHQHQLQLQPFMQLPYPNQQQYQQQPQVQLQQPQLNPGHAVLDSYRPLVNDPFGTYSSKTPHRLQNDPSGQEGPTRSHRRSMSSEHSHSLRFSPNRNHITESADQATWLPRPKMPGQPCLACSMSKKPCDGGSPCGPCLVNKVRCHYDGDNNTRFFGIDALQLDHPSTLQQHQQQQQQQPQQEHQIQQESRDDPDSPSKLGNTSSPRNTSRSRSRSGSGSASSMTWSSQEQSYPRVSPLISPSILLTDQSLISIPPFQEFAHHERPQHAKVTLPSISSMDSSIMPRSSASISSASSTNSRSSSTSRTGGSSSARPPHHSAEQVSSQGPRQNSKSSSDRPILPVQGSSGRLRSLPNDGGLASSVPIDGDSIVKRPSTKKHAPLPIHSPKDPLYSLSSASIRARKNALEMENIQRASHLYADFVAKTKTLLHPATNDKEAASNTTVDSASGGESMDVDMMEQGSDPQQVLATSLSNTTLDSSGPVNLMNPSTSSTSCSEGIFTSAPIYGLQRLGRSGLLHSLVQQYFTLVHPQFMILHKNHFLVRFWAVYGPFPEAKDMHIQLMHRAKPENVWKGSIEGLPGEGQEPCHDRSNPQDCSPLLLMAMIALISRHINDRTPLQSTATDKQRRLEKSLDLIGADLTTEGDLASRCKVKAQEARLEELMETDEEGKSSSPENPLDRGEQYFLWATELLKAEYEEPSLTVVQSMLLLREYAIMAGNHTQAYMYGGAAITMAMGLGWHHAHLGQTPNREMTSNPLPVGMDSGAEKAEQEKQREKKIIDEEQKLCWWHCFIIDRWMSAAYNRPVNIPVHIFDKTHLRPLPKPLKITKSKDEDASQAATTSSTSDFWLTPGGPDTASLTSSLKQSGGVNMRPIGSGAQSSTSASLPGAQFRTKAFFDQQCRQALLLDDILCFLSSWSEDLFVSSAEFEKMSGGLDEWYQSLADWQTFPLSGIFSTSQQLRQQSRQHDQQQVGIPGRELVGMTMPVTTSTNADEGRDVVQSTLLGITFHTIRILLYRPFLRTNLRHPPCQPARASAVCAQSANAMTSLAESLLNQKDLTLQPCLLMRQQFSLVTAAGVQLMNANLDDEPRLSTPAKINLLKTLRILRDADRTSYGAGVQDGFQQLLRDLFPVQAKMMYDGPGSMASNA